MKYLNNTTASQAKENVAEALTFVPNSYIEEIKDEFNEKVIARRIKSIK